MKAHVNGIRLAHKNMKRLALLAVFAVSSGMGQHLPETRPFEFDVAAVKRQIPPSAGVPVMEGGPESSDPVRLHYSGVSLMTLLTKAYSVYPDQVLGPNWLTSEKYTLDAKIPPGATSAQFPQMLKTLLIKRFGLIVMRDERDFNVYALRVTSGGPQLTPSEESHAGGVEENTGLVRSTAGGALKLDREGCPVRTPGSRGVVGSVGTTNCTSFRQYSMGDLVNVLEMMLAFETGAYFGPQASREHIVDRTDLKGKFDFNLKYNVVSRFRRLAPPSSTALPSDPDGEESLFKALERQLGLRLEKTKARLSTIVVRQIHKDPTND